VLQESVKQLAAQQEELFRALQRTGRHSSPSSDSHTECYGSFANGQRRPPLQDESGQLICYSCRQPGHTSRNCPRIKGKPHQANAITTDTPELELPVAHAKASINTTSVEQAAPTSSGSGEQGQEPDCTFRSCFTLDVLIDGVKTCCLLDTGSEVTTMSEAYFRRQFTGARLSSARWVKLTAANGLNIPVVGCLYADVECLGMKLPGKCVLVLRDDAAGSEERGAVPGILGMNILGDLRNIFSGLDGMQAMNRHKQVTRNMNMWRIFAEIEREKQYCGLAGKMSR